MTSVKRKVIKKTKQEPSGEDTIINLSLREQILHRPDTYIEGVENETRTLFVMNRNFNKIEKREVSYNHGLIQIFIELVSNAIDNVPRSKKHRVAPGEITIRVKDNVVSVENGGYWVPIEKAKGQNVYKAQLAWATLLTSSNYDDTEKRRTSGRNGYGAKLTNIFSKKMEIETRDPKKGTTYYQLCKDNMSVIEEPQIGKLDPDIKTGMTKISYLADFDRFKVNGYSDDMIDLMHLIAVNAAMSTKIPVHFMYEDKVHTYEITSLLEYSRYYFNDENFSYIHQPHKKYEDGFESEMVLVESWDNKFQVSFVNGAPTHDGGKHVDAWYSTFTQPILDKINPKVSTKKNAKDKDKKELVTYALKPEDVKKHIAIFVNVSMDNPAFTSQSKTKLKSAVPTLKITKKQLDEILDWRFILRLKERLDEKMNKAAKRSDGKQTRYVDVEKGDEANWAGTAKSSQCTLFLTEGDSAMNMVTNGRKAVENGCDKYGVFPLRGKSLNTMNSTNQEILNNMEIANIKKLLGLQSGEDYTNEAKYKKLRYGHVMILRDADDDGFHIEGLLFCFFYSLFPSLLEIGYVQVMETPLFRAVRGNKIVENFYSHKAKDDWHKDNGSKQVTYRHYKGLGTHEAKEQQYTFKEPFITVFDFTDQCKKDLRLAFDDKMSEERKVWLKTEREKTEPIHQSTISHFIQNQLWFYSRANLIRSIPMFDGFKESQRKIFYVAQKKNYNASSGKTIKVAQFAGYVAAETEYEHGEGSLGQAIVKMAQNYPGTNNLNLFYPKGNFGDRNGNSPAADRYLYTHLEWYVPFLFRKEDECILQFKIGTDGTKYEPNMYYPLICMPVVNGSNGIATGWNSYIHNHDVLEVAGWHRSWLQRKIKSYNKLDASTVSINSTSTSASTRSGPITIKRKNITKKLLPSYRGFNGKIYESNGDIYCAGAFETTKEHIHITELPIKTSYKKYDDTCKEWGMEGYIDDHNRQADDSFLVYGYNTEKFGKEPSYDSLNLIMKLKKENVNILGENGLPMEYDMVEQLMEDYSKVRLQKYEERRLKQIEVIEQDIIMADLQYKFISEKLAGTITIENRKKADVHKDMDEKGYPHEFLKISLLKLTEDEMNKLQKEIEKLKEQKQYLETITDAELWLTELDEFIDEYTKRLDDEISKALVKAEVTTTSNKGKAPVKRTIKRTIKPVK